MPTPPTPAAPTSAEAPAPLIAYFPPRDPTRRAVEAPIDAVTLLEDRALITRRLRLDAAPGEQRLCVLDVAPVLHDVTLRAAVCAGQGRVIDARVRRALRARRAHRPPEIAALEQEIEALERRLTRLDEQRRHDSHRLERVESMLAMAAHEIPEDAAWRRGDPSVWQQTLSALFERRRALDARCLQQDSEREDLERDLDRLRARLTLTRRLDRDLVAWVELDVHLDDDAPLEVAIDYTVPNALWRPQHQARLVDGVVRWRASAVVWQRTGEDWSEVTLTCSTARASLGTEPPRLEQDLLRVQRRSDAVTISAREVAVERAAVSGAPPRPAPPESVTLPGVDDGGQVQRLRARGRHAVPSDGRPVIAPLFDFEVDAQVERVVYPERDPTVHLRAVLTNAAPGPLLAGPVELLEGSGPVGWTRVLFVAPGAPFELGFGPRDALRVTREAHELSSRVDPVDRWRRLRREVLIHLSNLRDAPCALTVVERIPVVEVEHARVTLLEGALPEDTQREPPERLRDEAPACDDDGMCRWRLTLAPHERSTLRLRWELATAPDVQLAL